MSLRLKRTWALMVGKCAATQNAADTELESLVRGNMLSFAGVGLQKHKIHL